MTMDFKRHLRPEYSNKKRATKSSALGLFQSVELSLLELLPSRAQVRFTQRNKIIFLNLTQFIEHSQQQTATSSFSNANPSRENAHPFTQDYMPP